MKLEVFDRVTRERIGYIGEYTYATYKSEFLGQGSFEIQMGAADPILSSIEFKSYILFEEGQVGIVDMISTVEGSETEIKITGYMLNRVLAYRYFELTKSYYNTPVGVFRSMAEDLFINPEDKRRKIDFFRLREGEDLSGSKVTIQSTGKSLLETLSTYALEYDYGFELYPVIRDYDETTDKFANLSYFEFRVIKPVYRTIDNAAGNIPVVFSMDLNNLEQIEFEEDGREYCSMTYVAGEGEGTERRLVEVGDVDSSGIDRIEYYVDARDVGNTEMDGGYEGGGSGSGGGGTGDGTSGMVWRPFVSEDGTLSWTNSNVSTPPASVNIKGPKGDTGDQGPEGPQGLQGERGLPGPAGVNGTNGVSPTIKENPLNTNDIYRLDITTADSSFTTPNLKGGGGSSGGSGGSESSGGLGIFGFEIREDGYLYMLTENPDDVNRFRINSNGELVCIL